MRPAIGAGSLSLQRALAALALAGGILAPGAHAQELRLGTELQANTFTDGGQQWLSVAMDGGGGFVVVWESTDGQDGSLGGVFARRFSSLGTPLAAEFQVNAVTEFRQGYPAVAMDLAGDFVIAWESSEQDGSDRGIFARRFSSTGSPLASELQVNTYVNGVQSGAAVGADSDGDFLVAWSSNDQDGYGFGVFAQRFSSAGVRLGVELQVDTHTVNTQRFPAVAAIADRTFVVAWQSAEDGSSYGIFARRFSSAGAALGNELQINTYITGAQRNAAVAAASGGAFVVAWTDEGGQDGSFYGVFARRFSSAGAPLTEELQVSTYTFSSQSSPSVAVDRGQGGGFVVAWESSAQDGSPLGVIGRRFSSAGAAVAGEFQVNTHTIDSQRYPAAAASADGRFVVAWRSSNQDGSSYGAFAQRFAARMLLDIDGDGAAQALTDGLLLLRYGFGFTGSTLITGAVGPGCTRCSAAAIEAYLADHID